VDDPDNYLGRVVAGKYRVEAMIGEGGMGRVFRATQLTLEKPVVLKVLRQNLLSDERTVARFQREAKAASRLNHPNSITVTDFGQDSDGALYIAMEYVGGQDLHRILSAEWPLPEARVVRIMSQVLSALADAHRAGIIHRDLKPENIMVEPSRAGESDFVKVLDFGIAKIQDATGEEGKALTRAGFVCGTPEYMSPEQARGMGVDARSDLYAVGVILYQLTTGVLPFEAENAVGFATKHLNEAPAPPTQRRQDARISLAMERLILKALAKRPADRPQTAEAFKVELLAVDRERQAEQAFRLGRSSAVLAPLPPRAAMSFASEPTDQALLLDGAAPVMGSESRSSGREETVLGEGPTTSTDTELSPAGEVTSVGTPDPGSPHFVPQQADATPAFGMAALEAAGPRFNVLKGKRVLAVALLLAGVGGMAFLVVNFLGGGLLEQARPTATLSPAAAPVAIDAAPYDADPPSPPRPEEARLVARQADELLAQGWMEKARALYVKAFEAKPDPAYSLRLGALYYEDASLDVAARDREAKGYWARHLRDDPDCPVKDQLVALYHELAEPAEDMPQEVR
jgi:serine/threonine-protein kinase